MKLLLVIAALFSAIIAGTATAAAPFDFSKRPVCQVRNPPLLPRLVGGSYMHGEITQRCAGPVWRMGVYACLLSKRFGGNPAAATNNSWRVVWCEANEVYFSQGMTVNVEDYVRPAPSGLLWTWKVTGYVWVDYEPGPTGFYKYPNTNLGTLKSVELVTGFRPDQREGGR